MRDLTENEINEINGGCIIIAKALYRVVEKVLENISDMSGTSDGDDG